MCGIAGRVNRDGVPVSQRQLAAMSGIIAPRGPDGAGVFFDDGVGLAHRRLAIVDLQGGRQPAFGEERRVVLVYNGEIFNHRDLRTELGGHHFADHCDTEAVLHAHEEWGLDAPRRLRGMFAYAAWDRRDKTLTLARDHVGIKPLYYAHLPSGDLLFASDLRALLVEPDVDRTIDEESLGAYLGLRYVPAPRTILRGVKKLEPGCALQWRDGALEHHRWWTPPSGRADDPRPVPPPPPTFAEAAGRLTQLLEEVIGMWRMGDVPLGAFLSGGLDSTLVTSVLARLARRGGDPAPRTFSVGYAGDEGAGVDELAWARRAAAALKTNHTEVVIRGRDVAAELGRIATDLDEPLGDPAAVPLWFLTRRASENVTIALSGEGADEVFAGYSIYGRTISAERLRRLPGAAALAGLADTLLPSGKWKRAASLVAGSYRGVARAFDTPPWGAASALDRALASSWERASRAPTALGRALAFDQQVWLADDLLVKADKMTMAHALELRPPLLDVRLIEEIAAWPDEWKHDGKVGKRVLRAACEGLVPRDILDRPKNGFGTPSAGWLRGPLRELTLELLLGPGSLACDREEADLVETLLDEHLSGRDRSNELWTLLSLEAWRDAVDVPVVHAEFERAGAVVERQENMERSLVILLLDRDGQRSPIATAVRANGHRLVVATGLDTAEVVLGSLVPDVVIVRSTSAEQDRQTMSRLTQIAPEVPVRMLEAPAGLDEALEAPMALN